MMLMGVGSAGGAAPLSPVTLTFQSASIGASSGNTGTFGTITIGASPSANRRVIVVWGSGDYNTGRDPIISAVFTPDSGSPINADTVIRAGVDPTTSAGLGLISAVLPVGATTTLTVTYSNSAFNAPRFAVYTVDNSTLSNPTSPTPYFGAFTTSPSTVTANLLAGGALIAHYFGFSVATENWTAGVISDGAISGPNDFGHLSNTSASTGYAVTNTWTVSGSGNPDIALWVYR
jgi:hypothetical protein